MGPASRFAPRYDGCEDAPSGTRGWGHENGSGGGSYMRKKLGIAVGALALTFVLSSCWALQSFGVLDYTVIPGQSTKARFVVRPAAGDAGGTRMFVIVGVGAVGLAADNTDIAVPKATWGVTRTFGGPTPMAVESNLVTAMGMDCSASGLNFANIGGVLWKAFATPTNKNDNNKFEKKVVIDVVLKAKAAQLDVGANYSIMGVFGSWSDDGDGNPEDSGSTDDSYQCWGISTSAVIGKAG